MIQLKCNSCGGFMDVDADRKEAFCPYCGNHALIESIQGKKSELNIIPATNEYVNKDPSPQYRIDFTTSENDRIEIRYLCQLDRKNYSCYVAQEYLLLHFSHVEAGQGRKFCEMIEMLRYPNEDMKVRLHFWVPEITGIYELADGEFIIAVRKIMNTYPLVLAPKLGPKDVAWMISRLENLLCLLEFSNIEIPDISVEDLFFEPEHHQIFLLGGWQDARLGSDYSKTGMAVRKIAQKLLKDTWADCPKGMLKFIESNPEQSAMEDFAYWDQCLEKAFGRRRFIYLHVNPKTIYQ